MEKMLPSDLALDLRNETEWCARGFGNASHMESAWR